MKRLVSVILAMTAVLTLCAFSAFAKKEIPAVYASDLKTGRYEIEVAVSNSELIVDSCILTVSGNVMTADMSMQGYKTTAFYLGSADAARSAAKSSTSAGIIYPVTGENGEQIFTVRVDMLDKKIACAAYSTEKEDWVDRILLFKSDSLPDYAFRDSGGIDPLAIIIPAVLIIAAAAAFFVFRKKNNNKEKEQ
ncbi:MAG: hypothetical protein ACI4SF_13285 [Oscillospiraceae bacterium]